MTELQSAPRRPRAPKTIAAPDDSARLAAAVIPTNALAVLAQIADEQGVAIEPWLAGLGLSRAHIHDPAVRVSYQQVSQILRRALKVMRSDIGLEVGRRQSIGTFGVLGLAMMTQRSFGEAMQLGIEHHQVGGSLMDMEFEQIAPSDVALVARPRVADDALLVFVTEELFASSFVVCRSLLGAAFRPKRIELTYPAPAHAAEYRHLFRCDVHFGCAHNRAVVDAQWMAFELPTHHPVSARQALELCRAASRDIARESALVASVERVLRRHLHENPRLADVAQTLNLSERSLRRHLAAAGRIYQDIHDRIRTERALELLRAGALSIADIGSAVGFSDAREFRRAFKRWTGVPPREMRVEHRA